jgi:hypothetical protein
VGTDGLVAKFCEVNQGLTSAVYLVWDVAPDSALPAPILGANNCGTPRTGDAAFCGNWKTCSADDCTFDNGVLQFSSYSGLGGSMNASGEITQWDREVGRLVGWVKFDTIITTACDGTPPRDPMGRPCDDICWPGTGALEWPCRHDIGKHIEVDVDISWTPPPVEDDVDGGV